MSNTSATLVQAVAKKKPDELPSDKDKQINFRAAAKLAARLESVAKAFGVDVSNLVRLILNQNLPRYEHQAERIRKGLPPEGDAFPQN